MMQKQREEFHHFEEFERFPFQKCRGRWGGGRRSSVVSSFVSVFRFRGESEVRDRSILAKIVNP